LLEKKYLEWNLKEIFTVTCSVGDFSWF